MRGRLRRRARRPRTPALASMLLWRVWLCRGCCPLPAAGPATRGLPGRCRSAALWLGCALAGLAARDAPRCPARQARRLLGPGTSGGGGSGASRLCCCGLAGGLGVDDGHVIRIAVGHPAGQQRSGDAETGRRTAWKGAIAARKLIRCISVLAWCTGSAIRRRRAPSRPPACNSAAERPSAGPELLHLVYRTQADKRMRLQCSLGPPHFCTAHSRSPALFPTRLSHDEPTLTLLLYTLNKGRRSGAAVGTAGHGVCTVCAPLCCFLCCIRVGEARHGQGCGRWRR